MSKAQLKTEAYALIDQLPDTASWDDIAYAAHVRASIERGLADVQAGRMVDVKDLLLARGETE